MAVSYYYVTQIGENNKNGRIRNEQGKFALKKKEWKKFATLLTKKKQVFGVNVKEINEKILYFSLKMYLPHFPN